jgi:hypothetical protein
MPHTCEIIHRTPNEVLKGIMQIRGLTWKKMPLWPPEWGISDHEVGEEGVLANVQLHNDLSPACIFVVANYLGDIRKGIIILEDLAHLGLLYQKLKENLCKPLTEIGDLEIDFIPSLQKSGEKQAQPHRTPLHREFVLHES